ncbi:IS481 family transposase [Elusimicrobiota bacterium]
MNQELVDILAQRRKLAVLEYARLIGSPTKACREFEVNRSLFYVWRKKYEEEGEKGLLRKRPVAHNHPKKLSQETVEKILEMRKKYHLGPQRIAWYLERYHGITISCSSAYRTLAKHNVPAITKAAGRRAVHTKRYAKTVPGHHVQMDVKFLKLESGEGRISRRFQYTAIDDATRIRALKVYEKHNQKNAIKFFDHVIEKFPFRIHTIRTDRGHEFQAQFHWHVEDQGIRHIYIKARTPQLNGKVERSHRTDKDEFYQLLTYIDDVDLNKKIAEWEKFYNVHRPHSAFAGKTPYEALKNMLG